MRSSERGWTARERSPWSETGSKRVCKKLWIRSTGVLPRKLINKRVWWIIGKSIKNRLCSSNWLLKGRSTGSKFSSRWRNKSVLNLRKVRGSYPSSNLQIKNSKFNTFLPNLLCEGRHPLRQRWLKSNRVCLPTRYWSKKKVKLKTSRKTTRLTECL